MKAYALLFTLCTALPAGATTVDDPWILVPPLPGSCYREQDEFLDNVAAGLATLDEEISAQTAMNDEIGSQVGDMAEADPFEMAQRMQQYMLDNPEQGMKMMEGLYATGQTISEDVSEDVESEQERGAALDGLIADYRSAYAAMRAPIDARLAALPTEIVGEGTESWTEAAIAQLPSISQQANTAYEQLCAQWWQPGPFPAWLTEYHSYLVEERVPREQGLAEQTRQQWDIQGIDTENFQSTAAMDAARNYMKRLQQIYAERQARPSSFHVEPGGYAEYDYGR